MGFSVVRRHIKIYRNRAFKQAAMEKRLKDVDPPAIAKIM
jgi:hypothetical protein